MTFSIHDYHKLIQTINYHNNLYYNQSTSEISDSEYDKLFAQLQDIEQKHPDRTCPDSPTQTLHSQHIKQSEFKKATHNTPLLSLENTYNAQDIADRHESITRILGKSGFNTDLHFLVEPKYDGISVELIYKNGLFHQAITRGDGIIGEDITANVKVITGVPKTIPHTQEIHLRGEIVMPKSAFERVNAQRAANGEPLFANPRNAASGSIKQLDTSITAKRGLVCYVYDIL